MTDKKQDMRAEVMTLVDVYARALTDRIAELEAQLEAVGAGGVSGLMRQSAEPVRVLRTLIASGAGRDTDLTSEVVDIQLSGNPTHADELRTAAQLHGVQQDAEDAARFRAIVLALLADDNLFEMALDAEPDPERTLDGVRAFFDAAIAAHAAKGQTNDQ